MKKMMISLVLIVCLGIYAAEDFNSCRKKASQLSAGGKYTEALTVLQEAMNLARRDWQKYGVYADELKIFVRQKKYAEAENRIALIRKLKLSGKYGSAWLATTYLEEAGIKIAKGEKAAALQALQEILDLKLDKGQWFSSEYYYKGAAISFRNLKNYPLAEKFIQRYESYPDKKRVKIDKLIKVMKDTIDQQE